jgi:hypothetical protein
MFGHGGIGPIPMPQHPYAAMSFSAFQSDYSPSAGAHVQRAAFTPTSDASPKPEEAFEDFDHWGSFCQTPSLAEAILETDQFLVRPILVTPGSI